MARAPADCETMTELRMEIDRVDTSLFDLFAERMGYIRRAAEIKREARLPADIPARVEEVIENACHHAQQRGLDPELYGAFWEKLVRSAIAEEEHLLANTVKNLR